MAALHGASTAAAAGRRHPSAPSPYWRVTQYHQHCALHSSSPSASPSATAAGAPRIRTRAARRGAARCVHLHACASQLKPDRILDIQPYSVLYVYPPAPGTHPMHRSGEANLGTVTVTVTVEGLLLFMNNNAGYTCFHTKGPPMLPAASV